MSVISIQDFNNILQAFKIKATCVDALNKDNYFYYDLRLNAGGKVKDIQKYMDEISLALCAPTKPSVKVLHNKGVLRLEFISEQNKELKLFDYFTNHNVPPEGIKCLLGQTVSGNRMWINLSDNPHMIVAGTSGSGKSTLLHNIIANIINYNDVELILIDPKQIEFTYYEGRLNKTKVHFSFEAALNVISNLIDVMEFRYDLLKIGKPLTQIKPIVVIIDEFADLISQDSQHILYNNLCRLTQKCRAAKIHFILSTQRPSVNIINGAIKANFPARIACRVSSHVDSKVILDATGAENLVGKGDALIRDHSRFLERFQIAYTNAEEVCKYFGKQ